MAPTVAGSCSPAAGAAGWASTRPRWSLDGETLAVGRRRLPGRGVRPGARGGRRGERARPSVTSSRPGSGPLAALAAGGDALRARGIAGPALLVAVDLPAVGDTAARAAARLAGRADRGAAKSTAGSSRCAPATAPTRWSRPDSLVDRRRALAARRCSTSSTTTSSRRPPGARSRRRTRSSTSTRPPTRRGLGIELPGLA